MFSKSIRRVSSSYALFHNVRNNFVELFKQSGAFEYQAVTRRFSCRTIWACNKFLQTRTLVSNFCIISKRNSSHTTGSLSKMLNYLPFFVSGNIVAGFGRGSKDLGIPTANYPLEVVKSLPDCFKPGVYYGWANVDNGPVNKMVMSIGWNPFYDNKEKSMETHILYNFNRDLYGCLLKVCIVGYLRPEQNFNSLEDLVACIKDDIRQAENLLESNKTYKELESHQFFHENIAGNTTK